MERGLKNSEHMEKHPETGRGKPEFGCSKNTNNELWELFVIELNSLEPPRRTGNEWGQVWIHYKVNLKRELANNRSNYLATGGGPSQEVSLNQLVESVVQIIQTREQFSPSDMDLGVENIPPTMNDEEMLVNLEDRPHFVDITNNKNRRRTKNLEIELIRVIKKADTN